MVEQFRQYAAFEGSMCIGTGSLVDVAVKAKSVIDRDERDSILIFDDVTSELIEVDFRGTADDVLRRLSKADSQAPDTVSLSVDKPKARGRGRPKLGVVGREVTLLPRHWEWLNAQPGGASVALRKLVEEARRANGDKDRVRRAQEAAYRFMSAMAGNLPDFEEATRALFAFDRARFDDTIRAWPADVRDRAGKLASAAFPAPD